jgi:hypothetical protein
VQVGHRAFSRQASRAPGDGTWRNGGRGGVSLYLPARDGGGPPGVGFCRSDRTGRLPDAQSGLPSQQWCPKARRQKNSRSRRGRGGPGSPAEDRCWSSWRAGWRQPPEGTMTARQSFIPATTRIPPIPPVRVVRSSPGISLPGLSSEDRPAQGRPAPQVWPRYSSRPQRSRDRGGYLGILLGQTR